MARRPFNHPRAPKPTQTSSPSAKKDCLIIYNSAGKIVAELLFRDLCDPVIELKKGYTYRRKREGWSSRSGQGIGGPVS